MKSASATTIRSARWSPISSRRMSWCCSPTRRVSIARIRARIPPQRSCARLAREGKSLRPIGVVACEGQFERGEVVGCCDPDGREIARGLINYSAAETQRILRKPSSEIEAILGYVDEPELIHRDNLVLLG